MNVQPLPTTYRETEVEQIMSTLRAGDSCNIVGIGSVGKSNLLRFLQREDIHRTYFKKDEGVYLFVYVDTNKMLKMSFWGLLELMLHQLMIELTNRDVEPAILHTIDDLHQRATNKETRHLTLRYLDRAIGLVCGQLGWRLVFLIDEFDELCRSMSSRNFGALRALRDDYKYLLMYVVATRLELKRLRIDRLEIEAFEELVSSHTIWLGPSSSDDARLMLRRLEARHNITLDDDKISELFSLTGKHPGLMRESYNAIRRHQLDFSTDLVSHPTIQDECQRIWFSLSPEEQQVMVTLANGSTLQKSQNDVIIRLRDKGLLIEKSVDTHKIFSSLFAEYIIRQHPIINERIHIDHEHHTVWVNGFETRGLTPLEYKLIAYLDKRRGQICSRDDLAQYLYPNDVIETGVTDNRIDSVVKRLRKRIEPDPKEPKYILTVRGHGFRLVDDADV